MNHESKGGVETMTTTISISSLPFARGYLALCLAMAALLSGCSMLQSMLAHPDNTDDNVPAASAQQYVPSQQRGSVTPTGATGQLRTQSIDRRGKRSYSPAASRQLAQSAQQQYRQSRQTSTAVRSSAR